MRLQTTDGGAVRVVASRDNPGEVILVVADRYGEVAAVTLTDQQVGELRHALWHAGDEQ